MRRARSTLEKAAETCSGTEGGMGGGMVVLLGSQPPVEVQHCGFGGLGKEGRRKEYGNGWMEGGFRKEKKKKEKETDLVLKLR